MSKRVRLILVCSAERKERARLIGEPGDTIDILSYQLAVRVQAGEKFPMATHGSIIPCPKCGSALIAQLPGQSLESALADNCRPVVGSFRLPEDPR